MSVSPEEIRVGDTVLEEGDILTRIKFRPFNSTTLNNSPKKVKKEAATDIFFRVGDDVRFDTEDHLFIALQGDSAGTLESMSNQLKSIGCSESKMFMSMTIRRILNSSHTEVPDEIVLKDLGTESSFTVSPETLAPHLGETIFTTD